MDQSHWLWAVILTRFLSYCFLLIGKSMINNRHVLDTSPQRRHYSPWKNSWTNTSRAMKDCWAFRRPHPDSSDPHAVRTRDSHITPKWIPSSCQLYRYFVVNQRKNNNLHNKTFNFGGKNKSIILSGAMLFSLILMDQNPEKHTAGNFSVHLHVTEQNKLLVRKQSMSQHSSSQKISELFSFLYVLTLIFLGWCSVSLHSKETTRQVDIVTKTMSVVDVCESRRKRSVSNREALEQFTDTILHVKILSLWLNVTFLLKNTGPCTAFSAL